MNFYSYVIGGKQQEPLEIHFVQVNARQQYITRVRC